MDTLVDELVSLCSSNSLSLESLQRATEPFISTLSLSRDSHHHQLTRKGGGGSSVGGKNQKSLFIKHYDFIHEACGNELVTLDIVQHLLEIFPGAASKFCVNRLQCIGDRVCPNASVKKETAYPLHVACSNNDCPASVIELLIEKNPLALKHRCYLGLRDPGPYDFEKTNWCDGGLPLHCYVSRMSKDLFDSAGYINWYADPPAIDIGVIKMLVNAYPEALNTRDDQKQTPLHAILQNREISPFPMEAVRLFVSGMKRVFLLGYDWDDRTPLSIACCNPGVSYEAIEFILKSEPEAIKRRADGKRDSPMHIICGHCNDGLDDETSAKIAELFIQTWPECVLEIEECRSYLPIHLASVNSTPRTCKAIINADPDCLKRKGGADGDQLPLHCACRGSIDTLRFIFDLHPEAINETTSSSLYPLHIAADSTGEDTAEKIKFLLSCDPSAISKPIHHQKENEYFMNHREGSLPLHIACLSLSAKPETIECLYHAFPEAIYKENANGLVPLTIAMAREKRARSGCSCLGEIVSFLKEQDRAYAFHRWWGHQSSMMI